jgi:hypothetical protein
MDICAPGVGSWAIAALVIISKMATPAHQAMHRILAAKDCGLDSRENQPTFFI